MRLSFSLPLWAVLISFVLIANQAETEAVDFNDVYGPGECGCVHRVYRRQGKMRIIDREVSNAESRLGTENWN